MILLVELEVGIAFLTLALSSEDKADGADGMIGPDEVRAEKSGVGEKNVDCR